jgi:hypothetical protein
MRFAFIHVRKNAGTSINDALYQACVSFTVVDSLKTVTDWVSFTVVRNPYTRCISSWKYCSSTRDRSLLDCLHNPPPRGDLKKPDHDYVHFTMKQSEFIFDGENRPTHILRFEHLQKDLDNMFKLYNVSPVELKKLNIGNYEYQLTDEEREAVYQFYKEDFERLGYDK